MGPTLASAVYYAVIAPPQYKSEMEFTIRGRAKPAPDFLAGLGVPGAAGTTNDAHVVIDYIQSAGAIETLRRRYGFDQAYSRFSMDPTAYLAPRAAMEWAAPYWRHKIKAVYDGTADTITVSVRAYRPQDALRLAQGVLQASSDVVNDLNAGVQRGSMQQAGLQVAATKKDYDAAKARLAQLQGNVNALSYDARTKEAEAEVGQIDAALAQLNVNLGTVAATFKPTAPQARAVQTQIETLKAARDRALKAASAAPGEAATTHDVMLQSALLDYQFAQKAYLSAQANMVAAQPQSQDKNFVVAFMPPRLPERSDYWQRFLNVIAVFVGSAVLFGVAALSYSVIKDHIQ